MKYHYQADEDGFVGECIIGTVAPVHSRQRIFDAPQEELQGATVDLGTWAIIVPREETQPGPEE
jgi:hypothetical protein